MSGEDSKYKAPALERGLEILERLASVEEPLGPTAIADLVGRSKNEITRLLYVLESMDYIRRDPNTNGYVITNRMFTVAAARPATRSLVETAFPEMRRLTAQIQQSCHIAVRTGARIVVVARVEANRGMSLSVRVGHNRTIIGSASGAVLFANLEQDSKKELIMQLYDTESDEVVQQFVAESEKVRKDGYVKRPNSLLANMFDFSAPIFRSDQVVAALSVPFAETINSQVSQEFAIAELQRATQRISKLLSPNEDY